MTTKRIMSPQMAAFFFIGMLAFGCLSGCGKETVPGGNPPTAGGETAPEGNLSAAGEEAASDETPPAGLSGCIRMVGSTSMEKLVNGLAEHFMEKYPDVSVTAEFTGSGAGIRAVLSGTADIGNSSRHLRAEERAGGAVENIVALDIIAVCVDPSNTVTGLTRQQLTDIYTGALTRWSQLGGEDIPIVVVGTEAGSGTRGAFESLLGLENACVYANELGSAGAVKVRIAATPGAVGYIPAELVDESVAALTLEGAEPTAENIESGSYFLYRPFVMVTGGEICLQRELLQAWFDYVLGAEGRAAVEEMGLIAVD